MKIIFLDRDGVINEFPGVGNYVVSQDQFRFLPGAKEAIALLTATGYEINIISNQGCIARRLITEEGLKKITDAMLREIEQSKGKISGVFYCPHQTSDACECHKPKPGLLVQALNSRKIDRSSLYFIGDSREDVQAGHNFGCRTVLVLCGRSKKEDVASFEVKPDFIKNNLLEAAQWITQKS